MKKQLLLLFFTLLCLHQSRLSAQNVPDANFRNELILLGITFDGSNNITNPLAATAITDLYLEAKGISDLTGIKAFTGLVTLVVGGNSLPFLDVSELSNLVNLNFQSNTTLASLNITGCTSLVFINGLFCELTSITGLGTVSTLQYVELIGNNFTSLDFSLNLGLVSLSVAGNPLLATITLPSPANSLTFLNVSETAIASIAPNAPNLNFLFCGDCSLLSNINVSQASAITSLGAFRCPLLTTIDVSNLSNLATLTVGQSGLNALNVSTNLELVELFCSQNNIPTLDLSANTKLTRLGCNFQGSGTTLTSLTFSAPNDSLRDLSCGSNFSLTTLDVSGFPNLQILGCYSTGITTLDLSSNTSLTQLDAAQCSDLTTLTLPNTSTLTYVQCWGCSLSTLDVSSLTGLTDLDCSSNSLTSLTLPTSAAMTTLNCSFNNLTTLNISNQTALTNLRIDNNPSLTWVTVWELPFPTLSITVFDDKNTAPAVYSLFGPPGFNVPDANFRGVLEETYGINFDGSNNITNPAFAASLTFLVVSSQGISDLSGIEAFTGLTYLNCSGNSLTTLDVSANTALNILQCISNSLTSLDVTANIALTDLDCSANSITSLDVSANTSLTQLLCYGNSISSLDVSANSGLTTLICDGNQLTSLDVSANTFLTNLTCSGNFLTDLSVSANTSLTSLSCGGNQLTSLDVSSNPLLQTLYCYDNLITEINVSNNTILSDLRCYNNPFTSNLDLSNNTALLRLYCAENQLTSLDVSNNISLLELECSKNSLASLDVLTNTAITYLGCNENTLSNLILPASASLTQLYLSTNQILNLDLSPYTSLIELNCANNLLKTLNLSSNPSLDFLLCSSNQIPIVLTAGTISTIIKDAVTQVAVFRSDSDAPSIAASETGGFVIGSTGAIVNITDNLSGAASLSSSIGTNPSIVGMLPVGIERISNDKYWTIDQTGLSTFSYNLILDTSPITGITDFGMLQVVTRPNNSASWENVTTLGATVEYLEPFILVNGLTSFSDFAIGAGGADNPLPIELTSFTAKATEAKVTLSWATASERDNQGYVLKRGTSENGPFEAVADYRETPSLRGAGTVSTGKSYQYEDKSGLKSGGLYYYKLYDVSYAGVATAHDLISVRMPYQFSLEQNFPNPFNPSTIIRYQIAEPGQVVLKVFDILGREVTTLVNEPKDVGQYETRLNAMSLSSGIYFYRIQAGKNVSTKKMMLIK